MKTKNLMYGMLWLLFITPIQVNAQNVQYSDPNHLEFTAKEVTYKLNLKTYTLAKITRPSPNQLESKSPDGKWIAYTDNYNLYLKSTTDSSLNQKQ